MTTESYPKSACLLDLVSGRIVAKLTDDGAGLYNVAFNADGSLLAASGDSVVHVWDTDSVIEISRLQHEDSIVTMAFESDGKRLATVSGDQTARVWILAEDELIKHACGRLSQSLNREVWEQSIGGEKYSDICPNLRTPTGSSQTESP